MSKKVSFARLQTRIFVGGAGELGDTLPCKEKTLQKLEMELGPEGLYASFEVKGIKKQIVVPYANISFLDMVIEKPAVQAPYQDKK